MNNPAPRDKTRSHLRAVKFSPTPEPPPARPLSWRSPGTLLLAALLAFQIGLVGTLLWTLGRPLPEAPTPASRASAGPRTIPAPSPVEVQAAPVVVEPAVEVSPSPSAVAERPAPGASPAAAVSPTPVAPPAPSPSPPPPSTSRAPAAAVRAPAASPRPIASAAASPAASPAGLIEVEIRSEPEGAEVHISGALWGLTPLTALLPPGAPVTIELSLDDYAPARLSWSSASKSRTLNAVLRPLKDL